MSEKDEPW
jgi:hypothetical protein